MWIQECVVGQKGGRGKLSDARRVRGRNERSNVGWGEEGRDVSNRMGKKGEGKGMKEDGLA